MKISKVSHAFCIALVAAGSPAYAAKDPMVGGAVMFPTKDIVDNAVNSADHTTLVAAVRSLYSPRPTRHSPNCRPAPPTHYSNRKTRTR
jgi:hypothetical protein